MTREYMDEQYLKVLQQMNDLDEVQDAQAALADEIANQDISSGQIIIYGQTVNFAKRTLLDEKISVIVPESWTDMTPEIAKLKYPYENRPPVILTDDTAAINFTVNHLPQVLQPDGLVLFGKMMKKFTDRMTKARFLEEGLMEAPNSDLSKSWFDFITKGMDDEIYNLMFFASLQGRVLIISFNCLQKDQERWKPIAFAMLKTLKAAGPKINDYARRAGVR